MSCPAGKYDVYGDGSVCVDSGSDQMGGAPPPPSSAGASSGSDFLSWIGTLTGIGVSAYAATSQPPRQVGGLGISGSAGQRAPASQSVGIGTIVVVLLVGLLVWFGVKGR